MKALFSVCLLALALFASSCGESIYNEHKAVQDFLSWKKGESFTFNVTVADASKSYDIVLSIRHATEVKYQAIKVKAAIVGPNGFAENGDYSVAIRDQEGNLMGSAAGDICDTESVMLGNFKFPAPGAYTFTILPEVEAGSDVVEGIMEVGLMIDPAGQD